VSTFLAVFGPRGLIFIVDVTLVGLCSTAVHVLALAQFGSVAAAPNCA
jgi:hypothetical protein